VLRLPYCHATGLAPPQAYDDNFVYTPNTLTVSPPGVLTNDKYNPSCPASEVTVHLLTQPKSGVVTLTPSGGFTYKVGPETTGPCYANLGRGAGGRQGPLHCLACANKRTTLEHTSVPCQGHTLQLLEHRLRWHLQCILPLQTAQ